MSNEPLPIPPLFMELITLINRMPVQSNIWKRLRICVTTEELDSFRAHFQSDQSCIQFIWAVRGVPLEIDPNPMDLHYIMEPLHAQPS